jgi:integrase
VVRAWWARQQTRHRAPESANKCLARLKHILKLAVEWELIGKSPVAGIRKLRVGRGRERYLTDDQRELLIERANPHLKPYILGGAYAGGRRRSLFGLEERDLDLDRMLLTFRDTKNSEDNVVPLHPRFLEVVRPLLTGDPTNRILKGYSSPDGVSHAFRMLARRLGIRDFRFHDLRHDIGTRLARNRQPQRVIMKVLGHRDPRMSVRYTHAAEETVRNALGELE